MNLQELDWEDVIGLRIWTSGALLSTWLWNCMHNLTGRGTTGFWRRSPTQNFSWIATNKFNHNELRSYRGNIVTGLPLQEWLTRPYDILEHHQPHHIPNLQDSPHHTLDYSSKFFPRHITLSPNVLLLDNWHAHCCHTQIRKISITTYFFTATWPNPCLIVTNFHTLYTCITFPSSPTAHYRLNVEYTACYLRLRNAGSTTNMQH
jgi:hypothetical protein